MSELTPKERDRLWAAMQKRDGQRCLHNIAAEVEHLIDERMEAAGTMLLRKAGAEFEANGPESRFGAGIWAAGAYLREGYDQGEQAEAQRWMADRRLELEYGEAIDE